MIYALSVDGLVQGWFLLPVGSQTSGEAETPYIGFVAELDGGNATWRPGPPHRSYRIPIGQAFEFHTGWDGDGSDLYPDGVLMPFYEFDARLFHPFTLCQTYPPE